jgi:hypothetical protein
MLLTPHAVSGATIAVLIPDPARSVPLALASHFLLDIVPHWQETLPPYTPHTGTWIRLPLDLGLAASLVALIARDHPAEAPAIWTAACAAMLPDADSALSIVPDLSHNAALRRYTLQHAGLQNETSSLWGLVPQIALIVACLWVSRVSK